MLANASILMRIRHLSDELPPTARRIAAYIEDHANEVIRMSITEVAEQAHASEGSVVGLCRRLGVSGFQELKILLSRDLVEPMRFIHEDLRPSDTVTDVSEHVFAAHIASLQETLKLLSARTLSRAVEILRAAKRVEVYGIGSAAPIAQDLGYRLLQLGYDTKTVTDSHIQAVSAAMTDSGTAVITISHSGSTVETVLATELAHDAGARTIGITRMGKSPLARHCDVVLHTIANETRYRPEAMSSRVAQLAIIDTLVSCCALADAKRSISRLQLSARVLAGKRF
ncbi:MAG TPA: MurR/RpiR family transcriptional regulator [Reyranella sp.]|nr:MurR/RpiR family transcriptional regulator [Reyranella sp.]